MSLQIWLPLDGSVENKGLVDWNPTVTGATYVDGKIGKALNQGKIIMPADVTSQVLNNDAVSYCCWIYVNAEQGSRSNRALIFGNESMTAPNNRKFSIFQFPACNDLHLSWQNEITNEAFYAPRFLGVLPSYKWTHIAVTYQNPDIKVYINGKLIATGQGVSNSQSFAYDTDFIHDSEYHYLNDVRLYNHCLSPKEVREISKGLCLHYRLSGHGGENLLKNAPPNFESIFSNFNGNINTCVNIGQLHIEDVEANEPITLKAVYKYKDIIPSTGNTATLWIQGSGNINSWTGGIGFGPSETISGTGIKAVIRTANLNESQSKNDYFWMNTRYDYVKSGSIQLVSIKAEKGKNATHWTPAKGDELYATLGYDSVVEPDCSGFGHDGVKSGEIVLDSDTPRYSTSYGFKDGITISAKEKMNPAPTDAITISVWMYIPDYQQTCAVSCYESGGVGIHLSQNAVYFQIFGGGVYHNVGANISKGSWVHVVGTFDGENLKIYVNGQLKGAVSYSGKISYNGSVPWMVAGNPDANGNASENFTGRLSDLRIYATALSGEDILDLYQTGASIDNAGGAYTYELMEEQWNT